jgi:hypothetical protein
MDGFFCGPVFQAYWRLSILDEFIRSTLDDVGPLVGDQGMKVLSEMNTLADDHAEFVESLAPKVDVL